MTANEILDLIVGTGVVSSLIGFIWQGWRSQRQEDERLLAQARALLMRLISLNSNDPSAPIHTGDPHEASQVVAGWKQTILDVRMQLENTALGVRSRKHRRLAARILAAAEPPLGAWDEGAAAFLVGEIKAVLAPEIVAARRDPHALSEE